MSRSRSHCLAIRVSIPQAVWIACNHKVIADSIKFSKVSIPQAVWIACNINEVNVYDAVNLVSIPQAVWIACNYKEAIATLKDLMFQYRKRYGLHAIPSLTALGTAKPRSGFSKRSALFGKSPQPRGIFLSPKTAENVRKPCNIKETFVHGKSMKLMAFSPKSLPSL